MVILKLKSPWSIITISLLTQVSLASEVYQWVDSNNIVHFSDIPPTTNNSPTTPVNTIPLSDYPNSHPVRNRTPLPLPILAQSTAAKYKRNDIKITAPSDQQTIRNNFGRIIIQTKITSELTSTQQLQLMLDNQAYGEPQKDLAWQLENIDRGSHVFSVNIIESGKIIASSDPITVYLHRASIK